MLYENIYTVFLRTVDKKKRRRSNVCCMRKLLSFPFFIFMVLAASCLPQTSTTSTDTVQSTVAVTRVVVESGEPTPTPAVCTPLPDGMELSVEPLSSESAEVQLSGLQPDENLTLLFVAQPTATQASQIETSLTDMVEPDGSLTYQTGGLFALSDAEENIWTVKVIHARGVACQEFTLP